MAEIAKQLASPEWWFTVVLVAFLVGIGATYGRDLANKVLSSASRRYRSYAVRRAAQVETLIELLVANPPLLIIRYVRAWMRSAFSFLILVLSACLPMAFQFSKSFPTADPILAITRFPLPNDYIASGIALGLFVFGIAEVGYALGELHTANEAHRRMTFQYIAAWKLCGGTRGHPLGRMQRD